MLEWLLYRIALRDLLRIRRVSVAILLMAAPAAIALTIRLSSASEFDGAAIYGAFASLLVFGFVLPILSVVFCTGVISQEMEQRTIVYLLTRPIARSRILLAKFAAAWTLVSATTVVAIGILAAVTYEPGSSSGQARLYPEAIKNPKALLEQLQYPIDPVSEYLRNSLSLRSSEGLDAWDPATQPRRGLVQGVINDLNRVIERDRRFYNADRFASTRLPEDARQLASERPQGDGLATLNRWLLEAAYPDLLIRSRRSMSQAPRDMLVLPIGALAYGAISLLLATLLNRALIVGLFLAFGWESWVSLLPGNFKLISLMTYLRALAPHARPETSTPGSMAFFTALNPESVASHMSWIVLPSVSVVACLLAMAVFTLREYAPKEDA